MRIVVDTNVMVSAAILPTGRLGAVILHLRQGDFVPLYHMAMLEELALNPFHGIPIITPAAFLAEMKR